MEEDTNDEMLDILKSVFGHDSFRSELQRGATEAVMKGGSLQVQFPHERPILGTKEAFI